MIVDPVSFLCGVGMGAVVCRCIFMYWKEEQENKIVDDADCRHAED